MELVLVHLTDIHIKDDQDFDVFFNRVHSLSGAICDHITEPNDTTVLLCVTGDLAFSGKESQYTAVGMILEQLCSEIENSFPEVDIHPVFVPGNHDCDFDDKDAGIREAILDSPALDIANTAHLEMCTRIQKNYFKFVSEWQSKYQAVSCRQDRILTVNKLELDDGKVSVIFHCLNTSWCSRRLEEKGKMKIVNGKMKMLSDPLPDKNPNDIIITMMHHDAEWMDWEDKEVWNDYNKTYSDIVLVGHDHMQEYVLKQNYDDSTNYFLKGNQLYNKQTPDQSGFNILKINTAAPMRECFITYEWDGKLYREIICTEYREFKRNRFLGSRIELKKEVWDFLEELDIDITCGDRKSLKLSEVFGFPTLKEERGKITSFIRDMPSLMAHLERARCVSIRGQKEYGKTALLKQLFENFYEIKKFPIFLDISIINTADGEILNRIIKQVYKDTYNNIDVDVIMQKSSEERICLIDNFEEIKIEDKSAKKLLQYLSSKFGYLILTRNQELNIIDPLKYVETNAFIEDKFSILMLQPTRGTSKDRIINRWLLLNDNIGAETVAFDARRKEKYKQIESVMKTNYFSKTPIDLILVLSYLEEDHPTQLDYSRYSYVYDGLILKKLTAIAGSESGRITNNISIYKTILQKLAYEMYKNTQYGVDEKYVLDVIFDYKEHHANAKLKAITILEKLVEYQFLECKENIYKFKHTYVFYYFIGSYIESELPPDEKEHVIEDVLKNVDDDINYNVALFLAYKLNIEYQIIPLVKKYGESLLIKYCDFKYDNIKSLIEEWGGDIEKKIEHIYNVPRNDEIAKIRKEKMEHLEEIEEDSDTADDEVRRTNTDVVKIVRYIDYVGNILKNYSGKMKNESREEGIDFIFKSVAKVIGSFCNFSMYMVDKLIEMIEVKIQEGEENIEFKRQFVDAIKKLFAQIIFSFIEVNITASANSIDSDALQENISTYCEMHDSEFVKMTQLEYLIRISSAKLPVEEMTKLFTGKDCLSGLSQQIMKDNIYRYLTSYQFDSHDRQVVCSLLDFKYKDVLIQEQKNSNIK